MTIRFGIGEVEYFCNVYLQEGIDINFSEIVAFINFNLVNYQFGPPETNTFINSFCHLIFFKSLVDLAQR